MILFYIGFLLAFYWLMRESDWLRVRMLVSKELPLAKELPPKIEVFLPLLNHIFGFLAILITLGLLLGPRVRHIPEGIRGRRVWLVSPCSKSYGQFPLMQAERVVRKHSGWHWQINEPVEAMEG
jgi:hypothetical protein